jgi:transketolase
VAWESAKSGRGGAGNSGDRVEVKQGEMIAPRMAFGESVAEAGETYERLVVFDADVGRSTQAYKFEERFPERFYQVGIAEQNMMGIAAGMSTMGWLPFVSTFAVFAAKRALDQVRVSIAYPRLNVKINGAYGGVPTGRAGATHSSVADVAVMRAVPNMTVITTADAVEVKKAVYAALDYEGPVYLRTVRCPVPVIFGEDYAFEIGKAHTLRDGGDLTIIATGMMTAKALEAVETLASEGVSARLLHVHTVKPIDEEAIIKASEETRRIITVENHSIIGGLGGAVAEVLGEHAPCRMHRMGFGDVFIESGDNEDVFAKLGLTPQHIVEQARKIIES